MSLTTKRASANGRPAHMRQTLTTYDLLIQSAIGVLNTLTVQHGPTFTLVLRQSTEKGLKRRFRDTSGNSPRGTVSGNARVTMAPSLMTAALAAVALARFTSACGSKSGGPTDAPTTTLYGPGEGDWWCLVGQSRAASRVACCCDWADPEHPPPLPPGHTLLPITGGGIDVARLTSLRRATRAASLPQLPCPQPLDVTRGLPLHPQ
jgi:hypothetical protein